MNNLYCDTCVDSKCTSLPPMDGGAREWEDQPHPNWDVKILEKEYEDRLYSEDGCRLLLNKKEK